MYTAASNVISCTLVPDVYTAGTNISIDGSNVISCTLVPDVYTAGTYISIDGSNVISCTLNPLNVSIDGTTHVPSNLAFVGFSGVESNGTVTISGSNFTYYAGTNIFIDGSNTIRCTLSPLSVILDGTSHTPTSLAFNGFTTSVSGDALSIQAPAGGAEVTLSAGAGISVCQGLTTHSPSPIRRWLGPTSSNQQGEVTTHSIRAA